MSEYREQVKKAMHTENQVRIPSGGSQLTGMLHHAVEDESNQGVVMCPPFGDERKGACRALAQLARTLASAGHPVVRFDYRGCGESPGDFLDATLASRLEDIHSAADYLGDNTGVNELCMIGLRLGATLAENVAQQREDCASIVLIEPIVDAAKYFDRMMQRKKLRQMMTAGRAKNEEDASDIVDLDGYAVRRGTLEELRDIDLELGTDKSDRRRLLVQVSFNESLRTNVERAAEIVGERCDREPTIEKLVMPPFWSRVDVTDTGPLDEVIRGFITMNLERVSFS